MGDSLSYLILSCMHIFIVFPEKYLHTRWVTSLCCLFVLGNINPLPSWCAGNLNRQFQTLGAGNQHAAAFSTGLNGKRV